MSSRVPGEASTSCGSRRRGRSQSESEEDRLLDEKEARAIARVLNAGPIATKDAAVLFQLARRTKSVKQFSGVDEAAVDAVVELLANSPNPDKPPGNKAVLNHVRDDVGSEPDDQGAGEGGQGCGEDRHGGRAAQQA
jgi:hypothetical protein